jgi:hypothetical protein
MINYNWNRNEAANATMLRDRHLLVPLL